MAVARAQQSEGLFSEGIAEALREVGPPTVEAWAAWEGEYRHETAAFVQAQRELIPHPRHRDRVYLGMTSSNLLDCSDAILWQDVTLSINAAILSAAALSRTVGSGDRMGRTHGREAEPVPIHRMYRRFQRDILEASRRLDQYPLMGSLGGPVGTSNQALTEKVVYKVGQDLAIQIDPLATQTSSRHRLGVAATNLIHVIGACEQLATHHRLESISGIDGFAEGFVEGVQKGSSVMPHKRNPIRSERICGLSRVARGHLSAVLETANTQWWERDLTNSSVEREAFWSLASLTLFIVSETTEVLVHGAITAEQPEPVESFADELTRRVAEGEHSEDVYREIQERTRNA